MATDGPFAESKESLAGYWMVDVDERGAGPRDRRPGRRLHAGPIEVRQVWTGRPTSNMSAVTCTTDHGIEDLLRELAPQVLGALVRRYGQFDACEDAVQEALLAAALQWPARRACRTTRAAGW